MFKQPKGIYNPENADVVDKRNYELSDEKLVNEEKKIRIGKAAAAMIEPGDIIIIDTGTTTEKLVRYIDDDLAITVLCYNANTMFEMLKKKSSNILFAGGVYHANTQMFESPEGINLIPVSYTHLDVYKRQDLRDHRTGIPSGTGRSRSRRAPVP